MILRSARPLALLAALACTAAGAPDDFRYKVETLVEGMPQPMQLHFAPDGRIFFNELGGKLKIYDPATKAVTEVGQLEVTLAQENGFLGFALDPAFGENQFVYCLYSPPDFDGQRLSRFKIAGNKLDLSSEKLILSFEEQRKDCCHHAGKVMFGPDGLLYFSTGDNTNPFEYSKAYSPIDERPNRGPYDAQKSASNANDLRGKINRIRIKADGSYDIPPGNLFPPGTPGTRPEIYVMGCRNPWRFNFDWKTGYLYFGDVGPDAGSESKERGPRGFDEINQVRKAGFFGWPYFIADNRAYNEVDFATDKVLGTFDPAKPINNSPNNTGRQDLPPAVPAWIYYPGGASKEFPQLGSGGRTACAGPAFHWKPEYEKTGGLPRELDNSVLIYDWQRPFLKWARLDQDSNLIGIEDFTSAVKTLGDQQPASSAGGAFVIRRPVDMTIGKDGCLYLMDYGLTWGANKDSKLIRISYQRGNIAPIAIATAANPAGREPHTVELSSAGSKDLEGTPLKFEWRIGDRILSTEPNPKVTLREVGNFQIELRVTDEGGATGTSSVVVSVGNTPPTITFESPQEGDFFTPGQPVKFRVRAEDSEDGSSANKPEDFGPRTLVSASWERIDGKVQEIDSGLARMQQSDCFNCHAMEQQVVGPPLLEIAKKYRGQPGAEDTAVARIINGSTGVWGQVPMLPHPQHTADEVHMMVRWIFSLEPGKSTPVLLRGLAGEISAPKDNKIGTCVLEAVYTDLGRGLAAPLSGKQSIRLRSRRVEAESGEIHGARTLDFGSASGKKGLGAIDDRHHVKFSSLNLADCGSVTVRTASAGQGGKIELRADSPQGELLATIDVPVTGGWETWQEHTAPLPNRNTRNDVFVVFRNPGKGGLMNLDWVQFNPR